MTSEAFEQQMNRLVEVYGSKAYPRERMIVYWNKIKQYSNEWLKQTVDNFIAYELHPPLMAKWEEQISKENERLHNLKKGQIIEEPKSVGLYGCEICDGEGIYFDEQNKGMTVCHCYFRLSKKERKL